MAHDTNLDLYPETLAHQFAKVEIAGAEFRLSFENVKQQIAEFKAKLGVQGKLSAEHMVSVRDNLTRNLKFAAGILSQSDKAKLKANTATVWLSDDTLIKQFNSREGQDFGIEDYADLPDLIHLPDHLLQAKDFEDRFMFIRSGKIMVLKVLQEEIFILSFRSIRNKELEKLLKKEKVIR